MDQIVIKIIEWCKKHSVTVFFIIMQLTLSIVYIFIPIEQSIFQYVINCFMSPDFSVSALNIIFSLLFSGIEVSISSIHYGLWLLLSSCNLFCFRYYFFISNSNSTSRNISNDSSVSPKLMFGPSYIVFSVYLAFVFIHRPILYFKIFDKFRFDDTLLYSIAVFQYMIYNFPNHFFDFCFCVISNIIWKCINVIFRYTQRRWRRDTNENENRNAQLPFEANDA
ncbi:hypothetical protein M9Y10_001747 [Tritrichomonas musculus]|uniref:TLC domain-containing protein n=1 Tax=Tritrichomonas musculus TaxID=1915356 RepID=A0ABR2L8V6_9EUKA